jgi:hypothetical protein
MDDYLHDELQFVTLASEKYINKWVGVVQEVMFIARWY